MQPSSPVSATLAGLICDQIPKQWALDDKLPEDTQLGCARTGYFIACVARRILLLLHAQHMSLKAAINLMGTGGRLHVVNGITPCTWAPPSR